MGVVVSLVFTYSGYLTGFPVQQMTILLVAAWLPWVMWLLSRTLDGVADGLPLRRTLPRLAWTGGAFAMAVLAGHPQTTMYVVYLSVVYGLFRALEARRRAWPMLAHGAGSLALGGLLSAAQWLPTLEFIGRSLRAELGFEAVSAGLPLNELVSVLYPGYFGGSPEYVGVFSLVLIAAALSLSPSSLRRTIRFWLGVGLAAMVLAFGRNTFLYPLAYLTLPGFGAVRQQERVFLLYAFAAAVLSGYGALALSRPLPKRMRRRWAQFLRGLRWAGGVALALTGLYIYGATVAAARGDAVNLFVGVLRHHIFGLVIFGGSLLLLTLRPRRIWRRGWGMALAAGWLAFNLFTINWQFNLEARSPETPFTPDGVVQFLRAQREASAEPFRIASNGLLPGGHNAAAVFGLEDTTGNTPLQLAATARFAEAIPSWRYGQLMNVRYVVDERALDGPGFVRRFEAGGVKVYEVSDPFPRARLVYRTLNGEEVSALAAEETDLRTTALLPPGVSLSLGAGGEGASARVAANHAGFLSVAVETPEAGLLVLSNIYDPGWRATLDGRPARLYRVNGVFQGVAIPAGAHRVTVRYMPASFVWGSVLSLAGLAGLVFGVMSEKLRVKKTTPTLNS